MNPFVSDIFEDKRSSRRPASHIKCLILINIFCSLFCNVLAVGFAVGILTHLSDSVQSIEKNVQNMHDNINEYLLELSADITNNTRITEIFDEIKNIGYDLKMVENETNIIHDEIKTLMQRNISLL